jgi:hypothetical protein
MTMDFIEETLKSMGFLEKVADTGINWVTFVLCVFSKVVTDKEEIGEAAMDCWKEMEGKN